MAAGVMPAAMIRDTASPASPMVANAARTVSVELGDAHDAQHDLGHDAERPLAADHHAEQVVAPGVANRPSEPSDPAVRGDERRPEDVVRGEPVFQAVRSAGVLGDVAADGADLLRRRIGCVEVAERPHRLAHVEIGDPRLHRDLVVVEVDVEDRSHPAEADDDAVGDRKRSTGQSGPRAARDERHLRLGACRGRPRPPAAVVSGSTTAAGETRRPVSPSHA